jgi:hypothetical protein
MSCQVTALPIQPGNGDARREGVSTQGRDDKDEQEKGGEPHENNQKFGLVSALLQTGAWKDAERVLCQVNNIVGI